MQWGINLVVLVLESTFFELKSVTTVLTFNVIQFGKDLILSNSVRILLTSSAIFPETNWP